MDEAWNRWDGFSDGHSEQEPDAAALRLSRRSGSFREPLASGLAPRNRGTINPREGRRPGRGVSEPLEQRLDRWVSRGRELVDGVAGARPGSRQSGPEGAGLGQRGLGAAGLHPARLGRWVEERFEWLLEDDADEDWREPWQEPVRGTGRRTVGPAATGSAEARRLERLSDPWAAPRSASASPQGREPQPRPAAAPERRGLEAVSRRPARIGAAGVPPLSSGGGSVRRVAGSGSAPAAEAPPAAGNPAAARPPVAAPQRQPLAARPGPSSAAVPDGPEVWPDDATFTLQRWQRTPSSPLPGPLAAEPPGASTPPPGRPLPRSSRRR